MSSKMFTSQISESTGVFNPQRYLEKFGYKVGSGLGKNEDGRSSHIQVYKKEDAKGIGAHEDYTKSFETLFNQAASKTGVLKGGITFFDSDNEQDEDDKPAAATDSKKRKKQSKSSSSSNSDSASSDSDSDSEPRSKKAKKESSSSAPVAPAPEVPSARTLPSSSIHFIKFNMGSKLLADSHAEVDLEGNKLRKGAQEEKGKKSKKDKKNKKEKKREVEEEEEDDYDAPRGGLGLGASRKAAASSSSSDSSSDDEGDDYQPEMKYISENKPRPAASSIPKAKENQTIKQGSIVKELNGHHLYHDRSQGKLKRLEEADRAFIQSMMNKQQDSTPARPAAPKPTPQSSPISAVNLSPSESSSDDDEEEDKAAAEREKARKERKEAKKAKKEKKEKKEKKSKKDKKSE